MKIKTVNITDQVVEYLKENIESGKWNIGEKIMELAMNILQGKPYKLWNLESAVPVSDRHFNI